MAGLAGVKLPLPWPEAREQVLAVMPPSLKNCLENLPPEVWEEAEEIRLRLGRPLLLRCRTRDWFLGPSGELLSEEKGVYLVQGEDVWRVLQLAGQYSLYALEEELQNGYLTLPGGHRLGLAGEAVLDKGRVRTLKNISSLNLRFSREVKGCGLLLMPYLLRQNGEPHHVLLFSPPRCGKTTMARDLIRMCSNGVPELGLTGLQVGVVDERSELAGSYHGMPQLDLGIRTDVLDGCPKAEGMLMLIRSMAPQILATDEIGREADALALEEALNAGIVVLCTAHGGSLEELRRRPVLQRFLEKGLFGRLVLLGRSRGPGTVEAVLDAQGKEVMRGLALPAGKKTPAQANKS